MRKTLLDKYNEIENKIEIKNNNVISEWLSANKIPKYIYAVDGYKGITDRKITKISINKWLVLNKFKPAFKLRPTKLMLKHFENYESNYNPTLDHICFYYEYNNGNLGIISGCDNLKDIKLKNFKSLKKDELIPLLGKNILLYEPRDGFIQCQYCGKQRLPENIKKETIISRMYKGCVSNYRNYCKDTNCASHDQMGHEG